MIIKRGHPTKRPWPASTSSSLIASWRGRAIEVESQARRHRASAPLARRRRALAPQARWSTAVRRRHQEARAWINRTCAGSYIQRVRDGSTIDGERYRPYEGDGEWRKKGCGRRKKDRLGLHWAGDDGGRFGKQTPRKQSEPWSCHNNGVRVLEVLIWCYVCWEYQTGEGER